jgi:ATP-dependent phosphofructokinase / diphosphate-dependent phosphofructokinase
MGRHAGWIAAAAGWPREGRRRSAAPDPVPGEALRRGRLPGPGQGTVARVGWCTVVVVGGPEVARRPLRRRGRHARRLRPRPARRGRPDHRRSVKDGSASSSTGRCPTTCSARRGIWPRRPTSNTPRRWARPAVEYALAGKNDGDAGIRRLSDAPYRWKIEADAAGQVANHEKKMPRATSAATATASPPPAALPRAAGARRGPAAVRRDGLPKYVLLKNVAVPRKLPEYRIADR